MRTRTLTISILLIAGLLATAATADYAEGVAALQAKNYPEAIAQFEQLLEELKVAGIEEDPQYFPYYFMLARAHKEAGEHDAAIASFKTALKLKSDDVNTQLLLGQTYYNQEDYRNSAGVLGRLDLSSLPARTQASVSKMLSVAYEKSGQEGLALANMEQAAKLNPNDAAAQFNYGTRALSAGYTADAVKALEKAVSLKGAEPVKRRVLVSALIRLARETRDSGARKSIYVKAVSHAKQLAKMEPTFDNLLQLAESQLGAQQYSDSVASLKQASAKKSSDWLSLYYLGQAYTAMGNFGDALEPLASALGKASKKDDQLLVQRQLGYVHEKLKNYDQSIAAYKIAGDAAGVARMQENAAIASDNAEADEFNKEIEELARQRKELERQMQALPGATQQP